MKSLNTLAKQYFETFSSKDLEGLKLLFDDDIILTDWEIKAHGKEEVLLANGHIFDSVDTIQVNPIEIMEIGDKIIAELSIVINNKDEINDVNIAATLLKVQERKSSKGNAYAILKLTDLTSVFELFIFSEILESNRNILKEGNSLILTVIKSLSDENNRFKRVNVKKIISLKDLINIPINQTIKQCQ